MLRLPAQQCRAEIIFLRLDGTPLFDKPMTGRWPGTPEPKVIHIQTQGGGTVPLLDNPYELTSTVDIYPGQSEGLDIVIRVEGETSCYGWSDETYYFQNWRNPKWELEHKLYLVEVTISSSGRKRREWFRINNDGAYTAFRLSELTPTERLVIQPRRLRT